MIGLIPLLRVLFLLIRLAEEVATASFRQMQDKIATDLSKLEGYYCEKQEAADRSVSWFAFFSRCRLQAAQFS